MQITITEEEAKAQLYRIYPTWHRRWGWVEANNNMKKACWLGALEDKLPGTAYYALDVVPDE
jgi:hypothetical protein